MNNAPPLGLTIRDAASPARDAPRCNKPGQCPTPTECRGEGDCLRNTAAPARDALVRDLLKFAHDIEISRETSVPVNGRDSELLREAAAALAQRDVPREPDKNMIRAGLNEYARDPWSVTPILLAKCWRAMWDASPQERSQRDDDARDAARYRWLRSRASKHWDGTIGRPPTWHFSGLRLTGDELDAAIDAAKQATMRAFDERNVLLAENAALRAECDALKKRNVDLSVHAYNWMSAHDSLKAGELYKLPAPTECRGECACRDLIAALQHFREWHAAHFDDFEPRINGELLCLANEAESALRAHGEAA